MPVAPHNDLAPSASSSSHSPGANTPTASDDRDELDFLGEEEEAHGSGVRQRSRDRQILDDDPIHGDLGTPLSFKRRQKRSLFSAPARLFAALRGGGSQTPTRRPTSPAESDDEHIPDASYLNNPSKDGSALDWYIEGPGRRVGYEDLTAIDWIFEYNKERQRLRSLTAGAGIFGPIRHLIDASHAWVIILFTGISVGAIAAAINIATDWLGDLKRGYCSSGPEGGHFYLSRSFCCYGYDQGSKCVGWKPWGDALGAQAAAGKWTIEYIFYLVFSVRSRSTITFTSSIVLADL